VSDHRDRLVDLDTLEVDAPARVAQLVAWLEHRGWSQTEQDWLDEAPTYRPDSGDSQVAVVSGFQAFDPGEGTDVAVCTFCSTPADEDEWMSALNDWFETRSEPSLTCHGCAATALVGDMDNERGVIFGSVALSFQHVDFEIVKTTLLTEVRNELGGRWCYVHLHL